MNNKKCKKLMPDSPHMIYRVR